MIKFNVFTGNFDFVGEDGGGVGPTPEIVELTTTTNNYQLLWSYQMPINKFQAIKFKIIGLRNDNQHQCYFERHGYFYNDSGTLKDQRLWQVISNLRSNENIDIKYELISDTINVKVKSLDTMPFFWKAEIQQFPILIA